MTILLIIFVWSTILSISLTITGKDLTRIFENPKLLINGLLASFLVGPIVALFLGKLLGLDETALVALITYMAILGAPFGPKLVQIAGGDAKYSVIFLIALNIAVLFVSPLLLSIFLPGDVQINTLSIIQTLIILIVIPLALGMISRRISDDFSDKATGLMLKLSNILLLVTLVIGIYLTWKELITISLWTYVVYIIVLVVSVFLTYIFTFDTKKLKTTIALTALPKNFGVVIAVVAGFDIGGEPYVLVLGILVLVVGIVAGRLMKEKV